MDFSYLLDLAKQNEENAKESVGGHLIKLENVFILM